MASPTPRDVKRVIDTGALIGDFAGFHINPQELDDLVVAHGIGCELRRGVRCPCFRIETGGSRSGCSHCKGLRFTYPMDLRDPDMIALVLNRDPRRTFKQAGEVVTGVAHITFPIGTIPAQGDILLPMKEVFIVHESLTHLQNEVSLQSSQLRPTTPDQQPPKAGPRRDTLIYEDAEVEWLHWIRAEDDKLIRARPKTDFTIKGREIRWKNNRGPDPGQGFSVRYRAPAAYMIAPGEPVARYEAENGYPYRCQGMRLDILQSDGQDLRQ